MAERGNWPVSRTTWLSRNRDLRIDAKRSGGAHGYKAVTILPLDGWNPAGVITDAWPCAEIVPQLQQLFPSFVSPITSQWFKEICTEHRGISLQGYLRERSSLHRDSFRRSFAFLPSSHQTQNSHQDGIRTLQIQKQHPKKTVTPGMFRNHRNSHRHHPSLSHQRLRRWR